MNTAPDNKVLTGTWKDGRILLDAPADWPEGCKLQVFPIGGPAEQIGIPDDQWPSDPQGIAELLERMDQIEPFEMTPEEEADWLTWRRKNKDHELANFDKRVEGLFEMSRYILDTGIASDYINRRYGVFERARAEVVRRHQIGIGTPALGELRYGVEASATRERNLRSLTRAVSTWTLWSFDHMAAEEYGRITAALRRIGRPMQSVDIQIAAIALCLGNCTVVSKDSDLPAVPGLSVENWATS